MLRQSTHLRNLSAETQCLIDTQVLRLTAFLPIPEKDGLNWMSFSGENLSGVDRYIAQQADRQFRLTEKA
jgi:hypothetical protein